VIGIRDEVVEVLIREPKEDQCEGAVVCGVVGVTLKVVDDIAVQLDREAEQRWGGAVSRRGFHDR